MRHRYKGPHRLVPFHMQLRYQPDVPELIATAQEIIRDERNTVLAVIQTTGSIFGGVLETDEHFDQFPISDELLLDDVSLITGFALNYSQAGILVMPEPFDSDYASASTLQDLVCNEVRCTKYDGQEVTIVWGHYTSRDDFVVDTLQGYVTTVMLPSSSSRLKAHFSALAKQLYLPRCWVFCPDQKMYQINWRMD